MSDAKVDSWIETSTGAQFFFDDIAKSDIRIMDVAHHLSQIVRYTGACRRPYTVAEHSCAMSEYAYATRKDTLTYRELRTVLMHDAPEYVIGDMSAPFKNILKQECEWFVEFERMLHMRMALIFDTLWPIPPWIKEIDRRIVADERLQVMRPSPWKWAVDLLEPLSLELPNHSTPELAKAHFMKIFTFTLNGQEEQEEESDELSYNS